MLSMGGGDRLCRAVGILIVTAFAFISLFLENESMLDDVFMSAFRAGFWHLTSSTFTTLSIIPLQS